jgi:hypothetical protein
MAGGLREHGARREAESELRRLHIFIRGLELVGDVIWENDHE